MSVIDTLIWDRVPGATYDWTDLNRVAEAMEYIAELLRAEGWDISVAPKRYTRTDKPTLSVIEYYLSQVQKLRAAFPLPVTTPSAPNVSASKDWLTVQDANDIEKILADIDRLLSNMKAAWYYTGELYSGEG